MRRLLCTLSALAVLATGATLLAEGKGGGKKTTAPAEYIHFVESWDAAVAEATERNVPIVMCWHKDH